MFQKTNYFHRETKKSLNKACNEYEILSLPTKPVSFRNVIDFNFVLLFNLILWKSVNTKMNLAYTFVI